VVKQRAIATVKKESSHISVEDILVWAFFEKEKDLRQMVQLWATQGRKYKRDCKLRDVGARPDDFLENNCVTIADRYGPHPRSDTDTSQERPDAADEISQRLAQFSCDGEGNVELFEQCERQQELSVKLQAERQISTNAVVLAAIH
jgi:hypothetical protein